MDTWLHAGLGAFLLVLVAYLVMLGTRGGVLLEILIRKDAWVLPLRAECVAVLPLLSLFRVWIAGDAGHLEFSSWFALFSFSAILLVNKRARNPGSAMMYPNTVVVG